MRQIIFFLCVMVSVLAGDVYEEPKGKRLRELAPKMFMIGTCVGKTFYKPRPGNPMQLVLLAEYNMICPENTMKFGRIEPKRGEFDFTYADRFVDVAEKHGLIPYGHNLIWELNNPAWLVNGHFKASEAKQILEHHIATVVGRYRGRIKYWDVVNEPTHPKTSDGWRHGVWYNWFGINYIEMALRAAHKADPDCFLIINDCGTETIGSRSDRLYNLVKDFVKRGVPIHGIGHEMHILFDPRFDYNSFAANMRRFAKLGLKNIVTEMDVKQGSDEVKANIYRHVMRTCLQEPSCIGLRTWGYSDKMSWLKAENRPLPFDVKFKAKPAYYAMQDELKKFDPKAPRAPIAFLRPSRIVYDRNGDGREQIILDGSLCADRDSETLSYVWYEGGKMIGDGPFPSVTLAVGAHTISVEVTDGDGLKARSKQVIYVREKVIPGNGLVAARDTYIDGSAANFGKEKVLRGRGKSGQKIYLGFDIRKRNFDHAVLRLVVASASHSASTSFTVFGIPDEQKADAWDETRINGVNAPGKKLSTLVHLGTIKTINKAATGTVYMLKSEALDSFIRSDTDGKLTIILVPASGTYNRLYWFSREAKRSDYRPQLVFLWEGDKPNRNPVARIETEAVVIDADGDGFERIVLDGSKSVDPDGTIASYRWSRDDAAGFHSIGDKPRIEIKAPVGTNTYTLVVSDERGGQDSMTVNVTVQKKTDGK